MIRHIVWWTLKPEAMGCTAAENAKKVKEMGDALMGAVPTLRSLEISIDVQAGTTVPAQVVLSSTHDDLAGLKAYAVHPRHLALVDLIKTVTDSRQAIDYAF